MNRRCCLLIFAALLMAEAVRSAEFTLVATNLFAIREAAAAWVDYDGDGDLDFIAHGTISDFSGFQTRLFRNDGGVFTNVNAPLPVPQKGSLAWGDYDRDNQPDLLMIGAGKSYIVHNDGAGKFSAFGQFLPSIHGGIGSWSDYDRDGDLDILVTGGSITYSGSIYRNDDASGFPIDRRSGVISVAGSAQAWGDYDNDGYPDVLVLGYTGSTNQTQLYRNIRSHLEQVSTDIPGFWAGSVAWGDYDNDGDLDLAISGGTSITNSSINLTRIYRNDASLFVDIGAGLPGVQLGSLAWGDYDNDGDLDLLLTGRPDSGLPQTKIYRNDGNDSFQDSAIPLPGIEQGTALWGDYDNDGDLDILICGSGMTRVYRNDNGPANTSPTVPVNLVASRTGVYDALFEWEASSDIQTIDRRGLGYNLRIGTAPGGWDILSPQADPVTGFLRTVQSGNAGRTNRWIVPDLAPGTYYWSVQAIDPGFASSQFASEAVHVHRVPPILSAVAPTNMMLDGALLSGSVNPGGLPAVYYAEYGLTASYESQTELQSLPSGNEFMTVSTLLSNLAVHTTYHYRFVASNSLGVTFGTDQAFTTLQFMELAVTLPEIDRGSVSWADYDNDGDFDVLLLSMTAYDNPVRLFRHDGGPQFSEIPMVIPGQYNVSAAWGDFDNDGDLDLVVSGNASNGTSTNRPMLRLYRNDGADRFTFLPGALPEDAFGPVAWADFDNDGRVDLLLAGSTVASTDTAGCLTRIYRNLGGGNFVDSGAAIEDVCGQVIAVADLDNDGDVDVIVSAFQGLSSTGLSRLFRNDGGFRFTSLDAGLPQILAETLDVGDFDNDDDFDLVLAGRLMPTLNAETFLIENHGAGMFSDVGSQLPDILTGTVKWGDYDNDGRLDLALNGRGGGAPAFNRVYQNGGAGVFTDIALPIASAAGGQGVLSWVDFDQDGDLDLFLSRNETSTNLVTLFRNETPRPNHLPSPPAALSSVVTSNGVRLSWVAAQDEDQTGGLSYNLRVGTGSRRVNVLSPNSDELSGRRLLLQPGNVGLNRGWALTNLLPGRYVWSVQAIDHSFTGSTFAPEQTFVIIPPPGGAPVISVADWDPAIGLSLELVGRSGVSYVVESSPDLLAWSPWRTVQMAGDTATVTDTQTGSGSRYFRARPE